MKYIDAEKLINGIKHLQDKFPVISYTALFHLITSLQQEQPEVELEKAYKSYMESRKDDLSGSAVTVNMKDLARHFYELGLNARKEGKFGD